MQKRRLAVLVRRSALGLILLLAAGAPAQAFVVGLARYAIEPDRLTVLEHPHPQWDPVGIRTSGYTIYPELDLGAAYDDNIFATDTGRVADALATLRPHVRVESNWRRNALLLDADAILSRYAGHPDQNSNQYSFDAMGVFDAHHDLKVTADASYARILLPRISDSYALFSKTPLLYDQASASVDAVKDFGRVQLDVRLQAASQQYYDGVAANGSALDFRFRNRNTAGLDVRADYNVSAKTAFFLREIAVYSQHDRPLYRYQETTETLIGIDVAATHHIVAELAAGVLTSTFSSPSTGTTATPDGRATVVYSPTRRLTLTADASRGLVDSGVPTSPVYDSTDLSMEADYELRRNVVLTGRYTAILNDYRLIDRRDDNGVSAISARYLANRGLDFTLAFTHVARRSDGAQAGRRFDDDNLSLTVSLRR